MKIYIIGPSGSGKTTLAKFLSKKYNISWYELDKLVYDDDNGHIKYSEDETNKKFTKILNEKDWIIEDVGRRIFEKGREDADKIYYLNLSRFTIYKQVLFRWIKQRLGKESYNYPPNLYQFFDMFNVTHKHFKNKKAKLKSLEKYKDKTIYLTKNDLNNIYKK